MFKLHGQQPLRHASASLQRATSPMQVIGEENRATGVSILPIDLPFDCAQDGGGSPQD